MRRNARCLRWRWFRMFPPVKTCSPLCRRFRTLPWSPVHILRMNTGRELKVQIEKTPYLRTCQAPITLTSNIFRTVSIGMSCSRPTFPAMPALLSRTSRRPNFVSIFKNISSTSLGIVTSHRINVAFVSVLMVAPASAFRPQKTTSYPSLTHLKRWMLLN